MNPAPQHTNPSDTPVLDLTDPVVFNRLWYQQQPSLFYLANSILRNEQEAEDVATESFVKLWQGHYQFSSEVAVKSWLRTTTRNACLNLLKKQQANDVRLLEILTQMHDSEEQWNHEEILGQLLQTIHQEIEALPVKSREVFKLRYIQGLKNEQIATELGIRHQSVRDHLVRALKTLRVALNQRTDLLLFLLVLLHRKNSF